LFTSPSITVVVVMLTRLPSKVISSKDDSDKNARDINANIYIHGTQEHELSKWHGN